VQNETNSYLSYYDINRPFQHAGFYETAQHKALLERLTTAIMHGGLIALYGMIGSGKTVTLRRLRENLRKEKEIIICRSMSIQKNRVSLDSLLIALYYDLTSRKTLTVPRYTKERMIRELRNIIAEKNKPVALFIDEAHDLPRATLKELKLLVEAVQEDGGKMAVILAGHPRLRNELKNPSMEEINYRTSFFEMDGAIHSRREYILWLLNECSAPNVEPTQIVEEAGIDILAERLITPLQINQHLAMTLEVGRSAGERPVSASIVQSVISPSVTGWESTLARLGYDDKSIASLLDTKPGEVRALFKGTLEASRSSLLLSQLKQAVGITTK
jgi:type II secretory pathway predicted ATPase ExeA